MIKFCQHKLFQIQKVHCEAIGNRENMPWSHPWRPYLGHRRVEGHCSHGICVPCQPVVESAGAQLIQVSLQDKTGRHPGWLRALASSKSQEKCCLQLNLRSWVTRPPDSTRHVQCWLCQARVPPSPYSFKPKRKLMLHWHWENWLHQTLFPTSNLEFQQFKQISITTD